MVGHWSVAGEREVAASFEDASLSISVCLLADDSTSEEQLWRGYDIDYNISICSVAYLLHCSAERMFLSY